MFGLFRLFQGRLCCTYSKSRVRAKPVRRWAAGREVVKWGLKLHLGERWGLGSDGWEGTESACQMGLSKYFQVTYLPYERCRYIISTGADYPKCIHLSIWYLQGFFFRFIKLIYCHFFVFDFSFFCAIFTKVLNYCSVCVYRGNYAF